MCLIIHSPDGTLPARETFAHAAMENPNGIGIMSERGVERWVGKGAEKRAWKYLRKLARHGVPYGLHFRWTTHGATDIANCHPHATELGSYVMHNGVLSVTASRAKGDESDTALYVREYLRGVRDFAPLVPLIGAHIGSGNKFLIMDESREFHLVNDDAGYWIDGLWYSNDYSLTPALCARIDELYPHVVTSSWRSYSAKDVAHPALGGVVRNTSYVETSQAWDNWEREQMQDDMRDEAMMAVYAAWFGIDDATVDEIRADLVYMTDSERTAFEQGVEDWLAVNDYSDRAVRV